MNVILELSVPPEEFELGRILDVEEGTTVLLETLVPVGERTVPFFRLYNEARKTFEDSVRAHPSVNRIQKVASHEGETLYALDWTISDDSLFEGILYTEAHLLKATGTVDSWQFEFRFGTHEELSEFQEYCNDAGIDIDIDRLYSPGETPSEQRYGLTERQRETLVKAVDSGYYAIPRQTSTKELADEFGISDQAVTERLRRAIDSLVTNTLIASRDETR